MAKSPKAGRSTSNTKSAPKPVRGGNTAHPPTGRGVAAGKGAASGGGSSGRAGSKGTSGSYR